MLYKLKITVSFNYFIVWPFDKIILHKALPIAETRPNYYPEYSPE
jgi:hypothetical protein